MIVSPYDDTLQKIAMDHSEVPLTLKGLEGKSDYYLHAMLEFDLNQDIRGIKGILRSRA